MCGRVGGVRTVRPESRCSYNCILRNVGNSGTERNWNWHHILVTATHGFQLDSALVANSWIIPFCKIVNRILFCKDIPCLVEMYYSKKCLLVWIFVLSCAAAIHHELSLQNFPPPTTVKAWKCLVEGWPEKKYTAWPMDYLWTGNLWWGRTDEQQPAALQRMLISCKVGCWGCRPQQGGGDGVRGAGCTTDIYSRVKWNF